MASHLPVILHPDDQRQAGFLLPRIVNDAEIIVFVGFGFHASNLKQLPFAVGTSVSATKRSCFSINPIAPPTGLLIDGKTVQHLKGPAETVIKNFLADLASGALLKPKPAKVLLV